MTAGQSYTPPNEMLSAPIHRVLEGQRVIDVNLTGMFLCAREAIHTPMNVEKLTPPELFEKTLLRLIPAKRIGGPKDAARAAVWLASDGSDYVKGTTICFDGGMTLHPGFVGGG